MSTGGISTLREFDIELEAANLRGQWVYDEVLESVVGGPKPAGVPFLWRWADVYAKLSKACDVLPESSTARRNLSFINPAAQGTTQTINMGMQMLKPGEIAWAHRHTMAALRFAIQGGPGLITVVDGEPCQMDAYDLVLTPRWTWHDHENATSENVVWLDVLDIGLVLGLNVPFYESFGEKRQPQREDPGSTLPIAAACCGQSGSRSRRRTFRSAIPGVTSSGSSSGWRVLRAVPTTASSCATQIPSPADQLCRPLIAGAAAAARPADQSSSPYVERRLFRRAR